MNFDKLEQLETRFNELERLIADPEIVSNVTKYKEYIKEHGNISNIVLKYREYKNILNQISELENFIKNDNADKELISLAESEKEQLTTKLRTIENELKKLTSDTNISYDEIVVEIRAAAGGEESALFAYDLFRMYTRYAERKGWKIEIVSSHETGLKGFKEVIFTIEGPDVYNTFKFESGIHRVQRIPITEASGRIHTSTVTVAVLPQIKEFEFKIKPEELKIDTFRASGHGGQHLQKTDSAVRITHLPTGITVQCQDERSQGRNREKAMRILYTKLYNKLKSEQMASISDQRRKQIGSGERAEKIRTYNFPQNRVTDHRINISLYNLEQVIDGDLDELIQQLKKHEYNITK